MSVSVVEWVTAGVLMVPALLALVGLNVMLLRWVDRLGRRTKKGQRREAPPFPDPIG